MEELLNNDGFAGADMLKKAMQVGHISGRETDGLSLTAEPLKAESVERTVKSLETRLKDIVLWNYIPKLDAYSTVEEYLQLESIGDMKGGFYGEGELSDIEDSNYIRQSELVKYIQVTGQVTMQAQMTRNFVDVMRTEVQNKTMWVLRKADHALFHGNSKIVDKEFNSLYAQHESYGENKVYASRGNYFDSNTVIDLRGRSLTQSDLEDASVRTDEGHRVATHLFSTPGVVSALSKSYFESQRIMLNAGTFGSNNNVAMGTVAKAIATSYGDIALAQDKFAKKGAARRTNDAVPTKAPAAPVADVTAPAALSATASAKFASTDKGKGGALGSVFYAVASVNRFGESALTILGAKVTTVAGSAVDLKFTDGGGANPATGYVIYRSYVTAEATAANVQFFPIFKVSKSEQIAGFDGGAAGIVRDLGRFLPGTEDAFTTEMSLDTVSFKQLAPISKLDLAVTTMANSFICFMFGTPMLYTQKGMIRFTNAAPELIVA